MAELSEICRAARAAAPLGEPLWLATVMRVRGSAYRHAGARLLFTSERVLAGSVSGGCLEASIVRKGPWLARAQPACISFDGGSDEGDDGRPRGAGCDGRVDLLIERVLNGECTDSVDFIAACLATEQRGALVTVFESSDPALPIGARVAFGPGKRLISSLPGSAVAAELTRVAERALQERRPRPRTVQGPGFEALLEIIEPAPHLFVFGGGPDAAPLVEFARALGLGVTVCDTSARVAVRERFPHDTEFHFGSVQSAVAKLEQRRTPLAVVMSHHYPTDAEAVDRLLDSRAAYIGVLGPARRTARLLGERSSSKPSLTQGDRARLRAPIGLDLGAETPAQIALSVVAEIQALLADASAEPLSRAKRGRSTGLSRR